ncbi:MAG: dehydratase [Parvibaculum sp.]|uniref:MaoC/PaaZ C-terminal domain-containing protein n=1 Tax=Parvibaculum sp. TaxID=2024848 RepID=UPI0025CCED53|nr:MaoC/PaaZ C-terminal domain-containing protein [Parvibaculum sp.]MCE9650070.1 dehydratase [Parvibaculum sp.]
MTDIANAAPGAEVGRLTADPITRHMLALYCGASGDHNPIHVDIDFAKAAGMPDVFAHGMLSMAFLARLLTKLAPQTTLRGFGARFTSITQLGSEITCTAKLIERFEEEGETRARLELVAMDQKGDVKLMGDAVVALR